MTSDIKSHEEDPLEYEEWDRNSPFWHHCLAGSVAGVTEHVIVYPIDTVKTHIQCANCPVSPPSDRSATNPLNQSACTNTPSNKKMIAKNNASANSTISSAGATSKISRNHNNPGGFLTTMRNIMSQPQSLSVSVTSSKISSNRENSIRFLRLWRGVHIIMVGCVPAHALYFSTYEAVKYANLRPDGSLPYWAGLIAGAAAVVGHDFIMSPLDTIKQRLQLGHYSGMNQAARHIIKHEGTFALCRSLPITLLTNIPYGSIMVSTNELCKDYFSGEDGHHGATPSLSVCLVSSSIGGMVASLLTTPLDRIKTMLQIQKLQPVTCERFGVCPKVTSSKGVEWREVLRQILRQEGVQGLFKGSVPRILSHTPAVAISWTTYETAKQWLAHF
mmetsp:Transcript_964/g.1486  ORF Transcript_964/g.1486 Transcript_964/m.1486 type:complete len:388 (+) Transcript_964:66-1229(+)